MAGRARLYYNAMLYQRQCRVESRYNSYQCTAVVAQRDPRYL